MTTTPLPTMTQDSKIAAYARSLGYNCAGWSGEFFVGAEFFKPSHYFGEGEMPEDDFMKHSRFGTIVECELFDRLEYDEDNKASQAEFVRFIYRDEYGNLVPELWSVHNEVFFKIPLTE